MNTQSINSHANPRIFLVSRQDPTTRTFEPVGILSALPGSYFFEYLHAFQSAAGARALGGLPLNSTPFSSHELFPVFANRIIGAHRVDRPENLESLGLAESATDIEILSRSEGSRPVDTIRLTELPDLTSGTFDLRFFVHGIRYQVNIDALLGELSVGDPVFFDHDRENSHDPFATLVTSGGKKLGYVPRALSPLLSVAVELHGNVSQINDPSAGADLRLMIRVVGTVDKEFTWPWQAPLLANA